MIMRNRLVLLVLAVGLWSVTASAFHFELVKSSPANKASVTAPARLQLWFTQVPAAGVSQLSLKNDAGDVAISKTVIEAKDKSMYIDPVKPLTPGRYTIHWRGAGDDGHVMQGDIAFTVVAK
jgi:methionine-rich copper-binding protein CopC